LNITELLHLRPTFHSDERGKPISLQLSRRMLEFVEANTPTGGHTLETGAGYSTVVFAIVGANHIAIQPDERQVRAIRSFCEEHHVNLDQVSFEVGPSERVLPSLHCAPLDLALIDGLHGFPAPLIDWAYIAPLLRVGGYLIVDDTDIWTGRLLRDFLIAEPDWQLETELPPRAAVFQKTDSRAGMKDWPSQPYVMAATKCLVRSHRLRKARKLLFSGNIRDLVTGVRRTLGR
jgi:predicted O-methyltransferase YrrM